MHVSGLPAEAVGGNPGKYGSESPEGVEVRQDDPMNVKDRVYNRFIREMTGRPLHWRMRPPSVDGWDNITHPERGPQDTGGGVAARVRTLRRNSSYGGWRSLRTA